MILMILAGGWCLFLTAPQQTLSQTLSTDQVIRLHVLANSDEQADQQVKYKVRDRIIQFLTPKLSQAATQEEAKAIVWANRTELLQEVDNVLAEEQVSYRARMQLGHFDFPLRCYGNLLFPAGNYEAVRILLGEGAGQNWWCVLFPPLCFIDGTSRDLSLPELKATNEEPQPNSEVQIKSKFLEWFKNGETS